MKLLVRDLRRPPSGLAEAARRVRQLALDQPNRPLRIRIRHDHVCSEGPPVAATDSCGTPTSAEDGLDLYAGNDRRPRLHCRAGHRLSYATHAPTGEGTHHPVEPARVPPCLDHCTARRPCSHILDRYQGGLDALILKELVADLLGGLLLQCVENRGRPLSDSM